MGLRPSFGDTPLCHPEDQDVSALYLDDLREGLGMMLSVAVNSWGIDGQHVADAFLVSGLAHEFERINPVFVAGKSGIELASLLCPYIGIKPGAAPSAPEPWEPSPDYWLGWSLGLFQVKTAKSYRSVFSKLPYCELVGMYHPLHEAPEEKFIEALCDRLRATTRPHSLEGDETNLKLLRQRAGLSQSQLARLSGTGLRSIQMFEQRQRDIARARAEDVIRLARVLQCDVAELLGA